MVKKKLVWDDDVEDIDLGDGDVIVVAAGFSVKDMLSVAAAPGMEQGMMMLKQLIKGWRGPSFERNGEPVPLTPENIERLDQGTAAEIVLQLRKKAAPEMDDEEKKASTSESSGISETL